MRSSPTSCPHAGSNEVDEVVASLEAAALGDEKRCVPFRQMVGSGIADLSAKIACTLVGDERIRACEALMSLVTRMWSTWAGDVPEFRAVLQRWIRSPVLSGDSDSQDDRQSFGKKLHVLGHNVMEDWEADSMKTSVDFLLEACSKRPVRVLDVGWGQGISGRHFLRKGFVEYDVVELHPTMAENARRVISALGVEAKVLEGALEMMAPDLKRRSYDIVYYDAYTPTLLSGTPDAMRENNAFAAHYVSLLQPTPRTRDFYKEVFGHYSAREMTIGDQGIANLYRTLFSERRTMRVEGDNPHLGPTTTPGSICTPAATANLDE